MLALNIDGLREPERAPAPAAYANLVRTDIMVISETHLRSEEARALKAEGFEVASDSQQGA